MFVKVNMLNQTGELALKPVRVAVTFQGQVQTASLILTRVLCASCVKTRCENRGAKTAQFVQHENKYENIQFFKWYETGMKTP